MFSNDAVNIEEQKSIRMEQVSPVHLGGVEGGSKLFLQSSIDTKYYNCLLFFFSLFSSIFESILLHNHHQGPTRCFWLKKSKLHKLAENKYISFEGNFLNKKSMGMFFG